MFITVHFLVSIIFTILLEVIYVAIQTIVIIKLMHTNEYVSNLISYNLTGSLNLNNVTTQSNCSSSLSFSNVTLMIKMKINLVYLIDFNDLTSLASLSLIKNFEIFVDINIFLTYFY